MYFSHRHKQRLTARHINKLKSHLSKVLVVVSFVIIGAVIIGQSEGTTSQTALERPTNAIPRALPYQNSNELDTPGDIQVAAGKNIYQQTTNHWYLQGRLY